MEENNKNELVIFDLEKMSQFKTVEDINSAVFLSKGALAVAYNDLSNQLGVLSVDT